MFMPPKYYRLLSPLNKLDPTDPRKVENFLIKLRALADCKAAFLPPITRAEFRLHFNLVGDGFWSYMDGMTEIEFFDDLYVKYLRLYASNNAALASYIIGNVEWEKHALLARLIRGTPGAPGWASTDDGHAMFKWLEKYGSTSDDASQELLITEFAVVMCESRLTKQGLARTQIVFKHPAHPVSSARIGRENRLHKVKFADNLEQQDDAEEEAPCHDEVAVDKCLSVFNRLDAFVASPTPYDTDQVKTRQDLAHLAARTSAISRIEIASAPGIYSSFVTNVTRPARRLATFVPHAARCTASALFVMLCVLWIYHPSCSCSALGCNVRDLHMMRYGTTLGSSHDGSTLGLALKCPLLSSTLNGLGSSILGTALDCSTLGSVLNGSRLGTSLDVLSSSRLSSALDGNSSSTLDGLNRLPLSSTLDGLGSSPPSSALDGLAKALDSVTPDVSTLSQTLKGLGSSMLGSTPVGSALDGSMLCSALDGLGGSMLNSALNNLGGSTLSLALDDLDYSMLNLALDGLDGSALGIELGGSTLSSAHDRSTLGSALVSVSSSALGFALDSSSLGSVLVDLRSSTLDCLDCSAINGLGRYSMTSFALIDSVLSSELNVLGSALDGVKSSTLGFARNGSTLSLVLVVFAPQRSTRRSMASAARCSALHSTNRHSARRM